MTNTKAKAFLNGYVEKINDIKNIIFDLLTLGELINFGTYDGKPLEWVIISKSQNVVTLLAKDIICYMEYHEKCEDITWEKCSLRKWLNNGLYSSFTSNEREKIIKMKVQNNDTYLDYHCEPTTPEYAKYHTLGGIDTDDYVYLLSIDEAKVLSKDILEASHWWWLRSPGDYQDNAAYVAPDGSVGTCAVPVNLEHGVRPALNLRRYSEKHK